MKDLAVALLRAGVTLAQLRQLVADAESILGDDAVTLEALDMLTRIEALVADDPSRTTLRTYGNALREAVAQANHERIRKGVDIVRPILEAHEQLDLTNA